MKTMARGNCREVGPGPAGPRTNPPVTCVLVIQNPQQRQISRSSGHLRFTPLQEWVLRNQEPRNHPSHEQDKSGRKVNCFPFKRTPKIPHK